MAGEFEAVGAVCKYCVDAVGGEVGGETVCLLE